jgi:hypothetical protein
MGRPFKALHMRISKENAQRIARALTKKTYDKWKKAEAAVPQYVTALYESKMPADVKKFVKDHPEYISTTPTIYLDGVGLGYNVSERASKCMPRNSGGGSSCRMKLTNEEAETLVQLRRAKQDAEKAWEDLYRDTTNAILALGTHKKIAEQFPQAANLLPDSPAKVMALIPNLDGLAAKLKNQ